MKQQTVAFTGAPAFTKHAYAHAHRPVLTDMDVPSTTLMQTLYAMLRVRRPHGGAGEARAVSWLANRLPVSMIDGAGNIHVDLRVSGTRTMFTAPPHVILKALVQQCAPKHILRKTQAMCRLPNKLCRCFCF